MSTPTKAQLEAELAQARAAQAKAEADAAAAREEAAKAKTSRGSKGENAKDVCERIMQQAFTLTSEQADELAALGGTIKTASDGHEYVVVRGGRAIVCESEGVRLTVKISRDRS